MGHYAFIKNNLVTEVITGKNENEKLPINFNSWEEYYLSLRPDQDKCKRTSYNTINNEHLLGGTAFRGNYAGIGFTYDETNDVFIEPKPFNSWLLDENTWSWIAPVNKPDNENIYFWNEDTLSWDLVNE